MRVLFISRHFPGDLRVKVHGVYKRMGMFIDAIKDIADLDLLFYVPPEIDTSSDACAEFENIFRQHWHKNLHLTLCPFTTVKRNGMLSRLQRYGAGVLSFFSQGMYAETSGSHQVRVFEECLKHQPDAIFVHRLGVMGPLLLTEKSLPPVIFDLDDVEHLTFVRILRQQKGWNSLLLYAFFPALWWGERQAIQRANTTFVCSETDQNYLTQRWKLPGVATIPNAVRVPNLQKLTDEPTLLFLGSNYGPNLEAVAFLIEQIWPKVHRELPMARLTIAGITPALIEHHNWDMSGVITPGFVQDLDDLYRQSRVVCAPILSGGGTRVKIIEAATYGKPIVSTQIGAEGIHMFDGRELLLRDDPVQFADACIQLLRDDNLCNHLGLAARKAAMEHYDREKVVGLIQDYLRDLTLSSAGAI